MRKEDWVKIDGSDFYLLRIRFRGTKYTMRIWSAEPSDGSLYGCIRNETEAYESRRNIEDMFKDDSLSLDDKLALSYYIGMRFDETNVIKGDLLNEFLTMFDE